VESSNLLPVVHTRADPKVDLLLQIRGMIKHGVELRQLFLRFRAEQLSVDWLRDHLATRVAPLITFDCDFVEVVDACLYLADEYNQLGEGYFIVSTETGKTTAVLTEDDLYDPGKMARHSGESVQGLQHIKPSKAVMLTTFYHESAREKDVLNKLSAKYPPINSLQKSNLRIATRSGRKNLVQELAESDPRELLRRSSGTTGTFLEHFRLEDAPREDRNLDKLEGGASFHSTQSISDPLTLNIHHNRLGALRSAIPQGWVRDICRQLAQKAFAVKRGLTYDIEELDGKDLEWADLWIADPDVYKVLRKLHPTLRAVPVEGVDPIALCGVCGHLVVPSEFTVEAVERFDRWEVRANISYELYVDWKAITVLPLVGVPREALMV